MESMESGSMALVAALERKEESLAFQESLVGTKLLSAGVDRGKVYKDLQQVEKLASLEDRSLVGPPLVE